MAKRTSGHAYALGQPTGLRVFLAVWTGLLALFFLVISILQEDYRGL